MVMIVVTVFSGALGPPRSPEDAGFHHTGVAINSTGHQQSILVMTSCMASVTVLDILEDSAAPFWK